MTSTTPIQRNLEAASIVESIGNINESLKKIEKERNALRLSLEQIARETGQQEFESEHFLVKFSTAIECEIKPSHLKKWLVENDKENDYFDIVFRVALTSLREHLGNDVAEELGVTKPKATPTMYVKRI